MVSKIISGGQTGADLGGLKAAQNMGILTGGTAPKNFKTELGSNRDLAQIYGLKESHSDDYAVRTASNISLSDATLIFASNTKSPGTKLTIKTCEKMSKPFLVVSPDGTDSIKKIRDFLQNRSKLLGRKITVNIAGNRESKSPGIELKVIQILLEALK
jgi:hypothetical protein